MSFAWVKITSRMFRLSTFADLGKRFPGLPLFLIGTSRGTISAAALGARFGSGLSGVVLTSTMFRAAGARSNEPGPGLSRFDFTTVKVPVLFVHHVSDQCTLTPYGDVARLADKYPLISVFGGRAPNQDRAIPSARTAISAKIEIHRGNGQLDKNKPFTRN